MKKLFIRLLVAFLAVVFIYSCKKEEYTEEDALKAHKDYLNYQDSIDMVRDSLRHLGGIIQYSVNVVPLNGSSNTFISCFGGYKGETSSNGLANATVSVSQHGKVIQATTTSSGIVVFYDLRVGTVSVNVQATGYSTIDYVAEIRPEDNYDVSNYYDVLRYAATMVPMFSLTTGLATIKGKVTYESNLTNLAPENAKGIEIIGMVDTDNPHFISNYLNPPPSASLEKTKYYARIILAAFSGLVDTALTNSSGIYKLQLPSTADGLCVKIDISDAAVDQQLLMNTVNGQTVHGVQTIRTIFGSGLDNEQSYVTPSSIPYVDPAYVTFSAPTGTVSEQPDVRASAYAVVSESGIASIVITNQGDGYTQPPIIKITGDGKGAEAVAYISNGKVTSVEITKKGEGYTYANISVTDKAGDNANASALVTYSVTKINMSYYGLGYKSKPNVVISSGTGTGATGEAVMAGYVSKIVVNTAGNGYVCPPDVVITGSTFGDAKATAVMTTYNSIHSIELAQTYTTNLTNRFETAPTVTITPYSSGGTGSGATAIATLATAGSVKNNIVINNGGSGYLEAPTVLIVGGGGSGAVADATITGGVVTSITVRKGGDGYTSTPTIQISAPPAGGTQATATAIREFPIEIITLTNAGSGYNIAYNSSNVDLYTSEPNVLINGTAISTDQDVIVRPNMSVESITISNTGSGYTAAPTVTFVPNCGYGTGATATAEILYKVDHIDILTKGSGYHYNDVDVAIVTPVEGCIAQAKASATLGDGVLTALNLIAGGDGYTASPNITITGNTCEKAAEITATISNGKITAFTIVDPGVKYTYYNNYTVTIKTNISGAALSASVYPESGKISFVTITNPGQGYTVAPLVKFTRYYDEEYVVSGHSFIDAQATAVIEDGRVVAINITNPGTGYYEAPAVELIIPDYLELAKGEVEVNEDGYVTGIEVTSGGMGYSSAPTVTITPAVTGKGSGATAIAVIEDGSVSFVKLTSSGSGYLGKNTPSSAKPVSFLPGGSAQSIFDVFAAKTYVIDIDLGTGKRTIED